MAKPRMKRTADVHPSQQQKAQTFRALHEEGVFLIPNPWDAGSAKVLAALGFPALATTSSGFAFTLGRADGGATLDEVVEHARALDRGNRTARYPSIWRTGMERSAEDAAHAITRVAEAGAVGGSIEDYDPSGEIYDVAYAAERVAAAAAAARRLDFPFITDRAGGEPHPRQPRPRRHDRPAPGV